jgi:hypothetical protein
MKAIKKIYSYLLASLWLAGFLLFSAVSYGGIDRSLLFTLKDQLDREDSLIKYKGDVIVLLAAGNGKVLRRIKSWEETLRKRYGETLKILRVANAEETKDKTPEEVKKKLQEHVPEKISLLIDWNGQVIRSFNLDRQDVNIVIFNKDLDIVYIDVGKVNDRKEGVFQALDTLLKPE